MKQLSIQDMFHVARGLLGQFPEAAEAVALDVKEEMGAELTKEQTAAVMSAGIVFFMVVLQKRVTGKATPDEETGHE